MYSAAVASSEAFTATNALTTLLTVESLLFAGVAAAASLSTATSFPVSPRAALRSLAFGVSLVLTTVAIGAAFAWARLFLHDWPARVDEQVPLICLAIGIAAQPVVAWTFVRLLFRRRT